MLSGCQILMLQNELPKWALQNWKCQAFCGFVLQNDANSFSSFGFAVRWEVLQSFASFGEMVIRIHLPSPMGTSDIWPKLWVRLAICKSHDLTCSIRVSQHPSHDVTCFPFFLDAFVCVQCILEHTLLLHPPNPPTPPHPTPLSQQ